MREAELNELELLIDGFLSCSLDAAGREALASRIESDPEAARIFDEALRTEALLHVAHTTAPAADINGGNAFERNDLNLERNRQPREILRPRFAPVRAWIAVAALVAVMFGAAIYYKHSASQDDKVAGKKSENYTVASGRVWVDGREAKQVAENEWLNVSTDGPAALNLNKNVNIELDGGSGALLRKNGATLLNGSGTFAVKSGSRAFKLETAAGNVKTADGEFSARLEPASGGTKGDKSMNGRNALALAVTVLAGTAQVEFNGKTVQLAVGESRIYAADGEKDNRPRADGDRPKPPELGVFGIILEHTADLNLSKEQIKTFQEIKAEMAERRGKFDNDPALKGLRVKFREALEARNEDAARVARLAMNSREEEIRKDLKPGPNPNDFLDDSQRRHLHEIMENNRPKFGDRQGEDPQGPQLDGLPPPREGQRQPPRDDGLPPPQQGDNPPRRNDGFPPPQGNNPPPPRDGQQPPPRRNDGLPPPQADNRQPLRDGLPPQRLDISGFKMLMEHADELKLTGEQREKLKELLDKRPVPDGGAERRAPTKGGEGDTNPNKF